MTGFFKIADIFSDNMVLQRGRPVPVWGWADPGTAIKLRFAGQVHSHVTDSRGRWEVRLDALEACADPRDLIVESSPGNHTVTVRNVVVGEVWICSGQSNMEWTVGVAANGFQEVRDAHYPLLRLLTVPKSIAEAPQTSAHNAAWLVCSPVTAANFSAVGYFFGRELLRHLNVPIGLINSSWGGTIAETWMSREAFLADPELKPLLDSPAHVPPNIESLKAEYTRQFRAIEKRTQDTGNTGWARGWADIQRPEGTWNDIVLPGIWQVTAGLKISGVLWFRKELELPENWAGEDLRLAIGACDKSDTTYFNNIQVGSMTMQDHPYAWGLERVYTVPAKLVRPGRNVIAVRVHSNMYGGGMTGPAEIMQLDCPRRLDLAPIPLAGKWHYAIEQNYGFVEVPPPPDQPNFPCLLFNAMIAPLVPLAMRGAIWYQGESNASRARQYRRLFPALIRDWRRHWRQGDFPFLFVQLANYMAAQKLPSESQWAELREAQTMALRLPNTGMAVAIDIGDALNIHPRNKQDVGRRLARSALADVYRLDGIAGSGPLFCGVAREGSALRVRFRHAEGLACHGSVPQGFAVAGADRKFVWAQARLDGETVLIWSPAVTDPAAVRYAWADNPAGNLYNAAGLPASPFRTDDWT